MVKWVSAPVACHKGPRFESWQGQLFSNHDLLVHLPNSCFEPGPGIDYVSYNRQKNLTL